MDSQTALHLPTYRQSNWFIDLIALGGVGCFLVLLYDGGHIFPEFLNPLFLSPGFTLGCIVGAAIFGAAALRWGSGNAIMRGILGAGIAALVVFPLVLPLLYEPYAPYAKPATGYTMEWITQPANAWMSAFKSAQRAHETTGCIYTLHGWTPDNELYYRSSCQRGLWRYSPASDSEPQWLNAVPDEIDFATSVDRGRHFENGGINYPDTRGFDLETKYLYFIIYEVAESLDGQWIAVAIMNYYGPRDVVILSQTDQ